MKTHEILFRISIGHTLLILILLLTTNICFASVTEHSYHFSQPDIKATSDGFDLVHFDNSYQIGKVGEPSIPAIKVALLLPPGHSATRIQIQYGESVAVDRKVHLSPKQFPRRSGDTTGDYHYNEKIYRSTTNYQMTELEVETHFLYGHSVALAVFSPVNYVPANNDLSYYSDVFISIESELDFKAVTALNNYRYSREIEHHLATLTDNFEERISEYPCQIDEPAFDYLIITDEDFLNDYARLDNFHTERGIKTKIVTTDEIYSTTIGDDEPEKIRNYIINQYRRAGISYVLLAGDADANPNGQIQVPIRNFYCEVSTGGNLVSSPNIPSDLYYAALDGTWNEDGDEKWGEPGEDDLLPELYVARICADNADEINAVLNKIINYQNNPVINDTPRMLMVGEHLWSNPLSYGADYLDLLIGDHGYNYYSTAGIPENLDFNYLYDRDLGKWDKLDLIQQINSGCNFIFHNGHSSATSNMRLQTNDITNDNFKKVDGQTNLNPIIYSHGCNSAAIDMTDNSGNDCIAERMLEIDNFASAYIGNSRYGWFNEGQTEGPSLHLNREFVHALYGEQRVTLGAAHTLSKINTAPFVTAPDQWEPGALRWCFYDCNVLGDAAMAAWTNQVQDFSEVIHPMNLDDFNGAFQVDAGIPDSRVTLTSEGQILATAISDQSGIANFYLDDTAILSTIKITVTAMNFKPFSVEINRNPNPSSVMAENDELHLKFELKPAYPNPFNSSTKIEFTTSVDGQVTLEVYNIMGQKVSTLISEKLPAGLHSHFWNGLDQFGTNMANGLYLFRLQTDQGIGQTACVLLK